MEPTHRAAQPLRSDVFDLNSYPNLTKFAGRVSDSGEGRWTIKAAIDEGVPVPVLTTALYERFASRTSSTPEEIDCDHLS